MSPAHAGVRSDDSGKEWWGAAAKGKRAAERGWSDGSAIAVDGGRDRRCARGLDRQGIAELIGADTEHAGCVWGVGLVLDLMRERPPLREQQQGCYQPAGKAGTAVAKGLREVGRLHKSVQAG